MNNINEKERVVLDASALLAYLFEEPGADIVAGVLEQGRALVSSVNYSEVIGKLSDLSMSGETIRMTMDSLDLELMPFDEPQAMLAGLLRKPCRAYGLSLGDRACFALAMVERCSVMTADKVWQEVPVDVEVRLIR